MVTYAAVKSHLVCVTVVVVVVVIIVRVVGVVVVVVLEQTLHHHHGHHCGSLITAVADRRNASLRAAQ